MPLLLKIPLMHYDQCSVAQVLQEAETDSNTRAPPKSHLCGVSPESLLSEFSEYLLDFIKLDLKSSFRIFSNRIGCVSDYAKRMVLQRLLRVYDGSTSLIFGEVFLEDGTVVDLAHIP